MKFRTFVLSAWILAASVSAGAKVIPPRLLYLDRDISVNGASIPGGMYTLAVESEGVSVRVTFRREGEFIATAHGNWVKNGVKYRRDAVLLRVNSDGTRSLTEIRLAGSAKTIVLDTENPFLRLGPSPESSRGNSSTGTLN